VLLGEEQAAEGHVAAGLRDRQLQVLAHEVPPEQCRQPVAVGVAPDPDEARRGVVDLAGAPILYLRQSTARAVFQVQLERPRVQRLTGEVLREVVLVQLELAALPTHNERARVLSHPGAVDCVDDLERVLDDDSPRHVQEGAAGPERRVRRLQLVTVDRQALGIPELGQLAVILEGFLQRAQDHAALGQRGVELDVDDRPSVLHDPAGVRPVGEGTRDDIRHDARLDLNRIPRARGLQCVEVEALQARRPETRAPPHR